MAVATQRRQNVANAPPVGLEDGPSFSQAATQRALLCRRINEDASQTPGEGKGHVTLEAGGAVCSITMEAIKTRWN